MEERIKMHNEAIKEVIKNNKHSIKTGFFLLLTILFFGISIKITFIIGKVFLLFVGIFFLTKFLRNLSNYIKDLIFYFIEKNKKEKNTEFENSLIKHIEICKSVIVNDRTYFEAKRAYKEAKNILEKHYYNIPMTTVFAAEDELKKLKKILDKCDLK